MRRSLFPPAYLSLFAFSIALCALAQGSPHGGGKAWSVADLFNGKGGPTGRPPSNFSWSPDGQAATYLSTDTEHGAPDDVIAVNAASGAANVLVEHTHLASVFGAPKIDEQDRDHRLRYGQSSYIWAPDGKHMLFDTTGTLWLYDQANATGTKVASTGEGSGDDPKFSPDGKSISFVRGHNLQVLSLADKRETALTDTTDDRLLNGKVDWVYLEELDVRSNYFWSPDSLHIAYLQMNEATVPKYPITDWIPTHSTVEEQRYPQPGDPNPGVRVGIVGANGGKTSWLKVPVDQHNDYIPRFGWLDDGHIWIEVLRRDQKHRELYFANTETGSIRKVLEETANKFIAESYDVHFLPNGQFLWTSWRDGHTHIYLYSYDSQDPLTGEAKLVRQVTQGNWDVLSIASIDPQRGIVYYTSNETDPREEMLWSIHLDGTGKHMLSAMHGVHLISFAPDSAHYVDTVSSLMKPPVASVCDLAGTCHPFWKSHPLDGYHLVAPKMFTGKAADGTVLYGELLLPPDMHERASVPLIVNPYGGPGVQIVRDQFGEAGSVGLQGTLFDQLLMQHGFAVLHVDNRGMGGRGRAFADAAYRDFGPVQLQDQLTMLDQALARNPQLNPKKLGWWGWSWGGTFTIYSMTHSDRFAAGVAVAPVTNWRLYDSIYTERYMGLPAQNGQAYRDDSVINSAANLHGHLLIAQGTGDDNVHMQNTIQFVQKLIDAGKQYDLLLYPRLTHSLNTPAAKTQLFGRILSQFETNLQ